MPMANASVMPMITTSEPKLTSAVNRRHRGVRTRLVAEVGAVGVDDGEVELVAGAISFMVFPSMMQTIRAVTRRVESSLPCLDPGPPFHPTAPFYPTTLLNPAMAPMEQS